MNYVKFELHADINLDNIKTMKELATLLRRAANTINAECDDKNIVDELNEVFKLRSDSHKVIGTFGVTKQKPEDFGPYISR